MHSRKLVPLMLATSLLAACSMAPTYERPAAPVPSSFPDASMQTVGAKPAAAIAWREYFTDARLVGLIESALANNRDLRIAVQKIEQARAQFRIQRAAQLPNLGVNAGFSRSRSLPQGPGIYESDSVSVGITAWELDFFGRIQSLKEAALAQYLSTEESRKAAQISLISAVANGWLALLADETQLQITRDTLQTRLDGLKLAQLSFDNGIASEIDLRTAQSLAESARAVHAQQRRQRAQDENALAVLLGTPVPPAAIASGIDALGGAAPIADLPAGLPSDLLIRRPDILAAEQQLIAANANIGAARAAFFPRISLTSSIGTASTDLSNLFDGGTRAWLFAPQLVLPIFDAGANIAGLDSAKAGREIALAQYEKAIQSAFREVADAQAGRATLNEQLDALRAQVNAETTRFSLVDLRYRNGVANALDLQDAQRSLFTARLAAVQTQLSQLQNQVTLYKVLGGGWSAEP